MGGLEVFILVFLACFLLVGAIKLLDWFDRWYRRICNEKFQTRRRPDQSFLSDLNENWAEPFLKLHWMAVVVVLFLPWLATFFLLTIVKVFTVAGVATAARDWMKR